jgi:type IV fimbrial biogenesis protein FimT
MDIPCPVRPEHVPRARPPAEGVTLMELVIAVAVVGVLAAVALPMFDGAREATRSGAAQQALTASVMLAAGRAATSGRDVVVCPGVPHACSGGIDWHRGWIAYVDADGDRVHDVGEDLLQQVAPLGGKVRLRSTVGRTRLVFQPDGGSAGTNTTFTLCDGRGTGRAVALVLNNWGRLRSADADAGAARACVDSQ